MPGRVENRCPAEHDELRWITLAEAATVELADPCYLSLIGRALGVAGCGVSA